MVNLKSIVKEKVPCDFCSEQVAVLYCSADSAKLCLFCDQHVHSANLLSRKHVRSQICDNCSSEPVSVRCATDNLVLCQECDWDAHGSCSVSASHDRIPIEGFSGCPSALELSSIWGFDIQGKKFRHTTPFSEFWSNEGGGGGGGCSGDVASWINKTGQDLMVPSDQLMVSGRIPSCGKLKQVIYKQLVELLKRDLMGENVNENDNGIDIDNNNTDNNNGNACVNDNNGGVNGGVGENLVPSSPNGKSGWIENELGEINGLGNNAAAVNGCVQELLQQQTPFTSLLMMQQQQGNGQVVSKESDENIMWNGNSCGPGAQVLLM